MADIPRPPSFLTLPAELRVMILKQFLPRIYYFGGYSHQGCPDYKKISGETNPTRSPRLPPCPCNDRQLLPLYLCKSLYRDMKHVVETAAIDAEYTSLMDCPLKPTICARIQTLTVDQTVFPVLECGIGFLEGYSHSDFHWLFPSLKKIIMPDCLGDGLGLRFPSSLPMHIYSCLRSRAGPTSMPNADCTELIRSDLVNAGYTTPFSNMEDLVQHNRVSVVSKYRYIIHVAENVELDWPFVPDLHDMREIYRAHCCGDIIWDQSSMRVMGIPDLRTKWWFEEWLREEEIREPSHVAEIDWTVELGGWDLMDLLVREDDGRRFWAGVSEVSYSFT